MKCSVHADQTVIMVCRAQQCESCFVCVLCIAGSHNGHKMATIEAGGRMAKKRLQDTFTANDKYLDDHRRKIEIIISIQQADDIRQKELRQLMETQGQRMRETVDKVIAHMISQYDFKYERRLKELDCTKHRIREDIARVQSSQDSLEQTLETDDWLQIVQYEKKKSTTTPKVEDLPEDITLDVRAEEVNNTLVTGILSALQQCQPLSRSATEEHESDFKGTIYRYKALQSLSSFSFSHDYDVTCIEPVIKGHAWIDVANEIGVCLCDREGIKSKETTFEEDFRGVAVTENFKLLVAFTDIKCVKKMSCDGEPLMTLSTDPWMPNRICVASNGDILVTQVSSFEKRLADTAGIVSRYTTHGKRMVTFERDRFGNTICPKFIAASRVSDLVVVTTLTNEENGGYNGHVVVMTGDLQVKFRYLSDGRVIPGDQQYHPDVSTKHFCAVVDSQDNIILGAVNLGSIEIIDKHGHKLQHLEQVDDIGCLAISRDNELWVGKTKGRVEVFKYT